MPPRGSRAYDPYLRGVLLLHALVGHVFTGSDARPVPLRTSRAMPLQGRMFDPCLRVVLQAHDPCLLGVPLLRALVGYAFAGSNI